MIVITAPTSQIGRQVVDRLLAAEAPLRLIVRDAASLSPTVRDSAEVIEGSHGDGDVVDKAFTGAEALFWLVPPNPRADDVTAAYSGFSGPALRAVAQHDVQRVVGISALGRGTNAAHRAGNVTATLALDDLFTATGVAYRALTMPSFMDNLLRQAPLIRDQGIITSPIRAEVTAPSVATADIAEVAAATLLAQGWVGSEEVPVLGPRDLSWDDMAATLTKVTGRPVGFRQVPGDAFTHRMQASGMSAAMADALLEMAMAKDAGLDNGVVRTSLNTTPTTFERWCTDVLLPVLNQGRTR